MARITVVGCGNMGSKLIGAFMKEGHHVSIVDLNEQAAEIFVTQGAEYYDDLSKALDSDFIVLNVPTYAIEKHIIESVGTELSKKKIVNLATCTPDETEELGQIVTSLGAKYLDGKIESYAASMGTDEALIVYSGDEEVYKQCEEALKALSPVPEYLGESVGAAAVIDIGGLFIVHYALTYALMEGIALAIKYNCPVDKYIRLAKACQDSCDANNQALLIDTFKNGIPKEYELGTAASLAIDYNAMKSTVDTLEKAEINAPLSSLITDLIKKKLDEGYAEKNFTVMMKDILK